MQKQSAILFKNATVLRAWTKEIGCTPSGVTLWMGEPVVPGESDFIEEVGDPDSDINAVPYLIDINGQCLILHPFTDEDWAFFAEYCASAIASGDIQLLDDKPAGWQDASKPDVTT